MRKNDNGKLIYLLVGVIGVLAVVFRLKIVLYAAELDSTIITSAQAETMSDSEIVDALVSEDDNVPDPEIIEGDFIDADGVYYANVVTTDSYDDTVLLEKLDDILVELRKPSIDYRSYLGQIQYSLTGSFDVPYPSDLPYFVYSYIPSIDKTVLVCSSNDLVNPFFRSYGGQLSVRMTRMSNYSDSVFECYYLSDGVWVSTTFNRGDVWTGIVFQGTPFYVSSSYSETSPDYFGSSYDFKLDNLNDSHTVIYYFTTIVPLLCVLTCVLCFVEIYRTSKMIRKKFIGGENNA